MKHRSFLFSYLVAPKGAVCLFVCFSSKAMEFFFIIAFTEEFLPLFKQTSRGWTRLVRPPGITAVAVLFSRSCCFTVSVRWALNESQTSKLWVFANHPGRARQTFSIQILTPLSSIHPFG